MLSKNNTKLGPGIWSWSLPVLETCPGASEVCRRLCYAQRGRFRFQRIQKSYADNKTVADSEEFVPWMLTQLRLNFVRILRIHVSGDFDTVEYVRNWTEIADKAEKTVFYAYTRSWVDPELIGPLAVLGRRENVRLYFSWDRSMPAPPKRKGIRTCYLSEDDSDLPNRKTDLIFRDKPKSVLKKDRKGNQVCPYDNGITETDCRRCGICWEN